MSNKAIISCPAKSSKKYLRQTEEILAEIAEEGWYVCANSDTWPFGTVVYNSIDRVIAFGFGFVEEGMDGYNKLLLFRIPANLEIICSNLN